MDVEKLKDETFKEAIEELKQENKDNLEVLKKLEKYEKCQTRNKIQNQSKK